jgi:CRP-like cAMP-binding protein
MPDILKLFEGRPKMSFERGQVLLREGEFSGKLYVMIAGQVEILKSDYQIDIVSDPGALFGEMSVLLGIPHMATVRVMEKTSVYDVDATADFLKGNSEICYHLSKMLAQRLNSVTSYLVDLKSQFEDHEGHLGIVDEVLETLINQQTDDFTPGSEREPNIKL